METAVTDQKTIIAKMTQKLVDGFKNILEKYPETSTTVEGFFDANREPINIRDILMQNFQRSWPYLINQCEEISGEDEEINEKEIHATLLHKYCGIDVRKQNLNLFIASPNKVNAYRARPDNQQSDDSLHSCFLQPFKLCSINEKERKYKSNDKNVSFREWLWDPTGCDSAPLFRKIFQAAILAWILQDYAENEPSRFDPRIEAIQKDLTQLTEQLSDRILEDLTELLEKLDQLRLSRVGIQGVTRGLFSESIQENIDTVFPDISNIASLYPLGRLLLGRSGEEEHHLIAKRQQASSSGSYVRYWLFSHLNFETSLFWLDLVLRRYRETWGILKKYVNRRDHNFLYLWKGGFNLILNAIILASAPLLIIFPWIYGITSIPFTLLRSFCLHGRFPILKKSWILICLDGVELIKDIFFFFMYVAPSLPLIFGMINALLPAVLVTGGSIFMFISLSILALLTADNSYSYNAEFQQWLRNLCAMPYFSFLGITISLCLTSFLVTGGVARQIALNVSDNMRNRLRQGISFFERIPEKIARCFFFSLSDKSEPSIAFPKKAAIDASQEGNVSQLLLQPQSNIYIPSKTPLTQLPKEVELTNLTEARQNKCSQ